MSIVTWIVAGMLAGYLASKLVNRKDGKPLIDMVLGMVGALIGGSLFNTLGVSVASGLNFYSVLVAVIGSVVLLVGYHIIFGPPHSHSE